MKPHRGLDSKFLRCICASRADTVQLDRPNSRSATILFLKLEAQILYNTVQGRIRMYLLLFSQDGHLARERGNVFGATYDPN